MDIFLDLNVNMWRAQLFFFRVHEHRQDDEPVCVVLVMPVLEWTSFKPDTAEDKLGTAWTEGYYEFTRKDHYGIRVRVSGSSIEGIGRVNLGNVLNALVNIRVLAGFATVITLFLFETCFPHCCKAERSIRWKSYAKTINEEVSFVERAAGFATRALVAAETHRRMDPNNDGLDASELSVLISNK